MKYIQNYFCNLFVVDIRYKYELKVGTKHHRKDLLGYRFNEYKNIILTFKLSWIPGWIFSILYFRESVFQNTGIWIKKVFFVTTLNVFILDIKSY